MRAIFQQQHKKIDGVKLSKEMFARTADGVKRLMESGWLRPSLTSITFYDPSSSTDSMEAISRYVRNQKRAAELCGITFNEKLVPSNVSRADLLDVLNAVNVDPLTTGVIIQRPVPSRLSVREMQEIVHPLKDVEGMHPSSIGHVLYGDFELTPCTAKAAIACLKSTSLGRRSDLTGLECVVVGHSEIVGKPISFLLMTEGATVTTCHRDTKDLTRHTRSADCVFVAVGKPKLITGDMLKPGCVVIDIGINPSPDGKSIVGDADFESCERVADCITPVPGGVGPVTTAVLMENTLTAAAKQFQLYKQTFGILPGKKLEFAGQ